MQAIYTTCAVLLAFIACAAVNGTLGISLHGLFGSIVGGAEILAIIWLGRVVYRKSAAHESVKQDKQTTAPVMMPPQPPSGTARSTPASPPPLKQQDAPVPMSACSACQTQNPNNAKFCAKCGASLVRTCPECGMEIPADKPFCYGCGTEVSGFQTMQTATAQIEQSLAGGNNSNAVKTIAAAITLKFVAHGPKGQALVQQLAQMRDTASAAWRSAIKLAWEKTPHDAQFLENLFAEYEQMTGSMPDEYEAMRAHLKVQGYKIRVTELLQWIEAALAIGDTQLAQAHLLAVTSIKVPYARAPDDKLVISQLQAVEQQFRSMVEVVQLEGKALEELRCSAYPACIELCDQIMAKAGDVKIEHKLFKGRCSELKAYAEQQEKLFNDSQSLGEALRKRKWSDVYRLASRLEERYPGNRYSADARATYRAHKKRWSKVLVAVSAVFVLVLAVGIVLWLSQHRARGAFDAAVKAGQYEIAKKIANAQKSDTNAVAWWREMAEQGYAAAQNGLGTKYANGLGVAKNEALAVEWYRKAAEQGSAYGQVNLGVMYSEGLGVSKDDNEAIAWYRKAAEQGNACGQVNLARMFYHGRGVARDRIAAFELTRKAAEQGDANGQAALGYLYSEGSGIAKDEAKAVEWYRKAAEQGDAGGQNNLGCMYENGRGVTKDAAEAAKWYRKAAKQGDADGQRNLGRMYADGFGVARDDNEAIAWYRKAAEQGNAFSQINLAGLHRQRRGQYPSEPEAASLYSKAAEQFRKGAERGEPDSQRWYGWMIENGLGVMKDVQEAVKWYRKAAEQGSVDAQKMLGEMYEQGRGVPKDETEAFGWWRKMAEKGDISAQEKVGQMYRQGRGVTKDEAEAFKWYRKAADQGSAPPNQAAASRNASRRTASQGCEVTP